MRPSQVQNTIELTSSQMLTMTIESLIKHFNLVVNDYKLSTGDTQIDAFSPDRAGDFKNHDHFALVSRRSSVDHRLQVLIRKVL